MDIQDLKKDWIKAYAMCQFCKNTDTQLDTIDNFYSCHMCSARWPKKEPTESDLRAYVEFLVFNGNTPLHRYA